MSKVSIRIASKNGGSAPWDEAVTKPSKELPQARCENTPPVAGAGSTWIPIKRARKQHAVVATGEAAALQMPRSLSGAQHLVSQGGSIYVKRAVLQNVGKHPGLRILEATRDNAALRNVDVRLDANQLVCLEGGSRITTEEETVTPVDDTDLDRLHGEEEGEDLLVSTHAVGAGGAGCILPAIDAKRPANVVLKKIGDADLQQVTYEAQLARIAGTPVAPLSVLSDGTDVYLELIAMDTDVSSAIPSLQYRSLDERLDVGSWTIRQVLQQLGRLHQAGFVHRDIKPANILCRANSTDSPGTIVGLSDFGWGLDLRHADSCWAGTPAYMAPEMLTQRISSCATDMWSVGVTLLEMLTGLNPFHVSTQGFQLPLADAFIAYGRFRAGLAVDSEQQQRMHEAFIRLPSQAFALVTGLLDFDPANRLSAHQALVCTDRLSPNTPQLEARTAAKFWHKQRPLGQAIDAELESMRRLEGRRLVWLG